MKLSVLTFGVAKDIMNAHEVAVELSQDEVTVLELKKHLEYLYPALIKLSSYIVALNSTYADDTDKVQENDEIAIIPPVSGG